MECHFASCICHNWKTESCPHWVTYVGNIQSSNFCVPVGPASLQFLEWSPDTGTDSGVRTAVLEAFSSFSFWFDCVVFLTFFSFSWGYNICQFDIMETFFRVTNVIWRFTASPAAANGIDRRCRPAVCKLGDLLSAMIAGQWRVALWTHLLWTDYLPYEVWIVS